MKRKLLLILGLLIIFTAVPVKSEDDVEALDNTAPLPAEDIKPSVQSVAEDVKPLVLPPKWSDFCETGYENAVYTNRNDIFNLFTFVKSERVKKNYWAERRASFESYLKSCNALTEDASKATCYAELKKSEEQKNDLYKLKRKQLLYENNIELDRR